MSTTSWSRSFDNLRNRTRKEIFKTPKKNHQFRYSSKINFKEV